MTVTVTTTRRTWRAWDTFLASLGLAFAVLLALMGTVLYWRVHDGTVTTSQFTQLLGVLRYGTYPIVFLALGSLLVHLVKTYSGAYARR